MKKKISIMLIMALIVFAFVPALTMAQDLTDDSQETVIEETEDAVDENAEETSDDFEQEEETDQISEELKEVLEGDYASVDEFLEAIKNNELLKPAEKLIFERKLSSYNENLNIESVTSVFDKVLAEEIELGQGFVILNNLNQSIANGYAEEDALKLMNSYQDQEEAGQLAFQTALELRKLSREDISGESSASFADEVVSIIENKGEIETSQLKQLAAEYRKEAREEKREELRADREKEQNLDYKKSLENAKSNNASENALNKDDKGKGNSNNSKSKAQGKDKSSSKSGNSSSNSNK